MAKRNEPLLSKLGRIAVRDIETLSSLWYRAGGNENLLSSWLRFKYNLPDMAAARSLIEIGKAHSETWLTRFKTAGDRPIAWSEIPVDSSLPWHRHRGSDFVYRVVMAKGEEYATVWVRSKSELNWPRLQQRAQAAMAGAIGNSPRLGLRKIAESPDPWEIVEITPSRRE